MTEPVTATVAATPTPLAFTEPTAIEVRGARVHNLKNLSLKVPLRQLVGIAGVSGSGKSSLALGVLCLLFDLGRIDRVLDLFLRPSPTYLTVGSFALAVLAACGAFLTLVRLAYLPSVPRAAAVAVEAVAVAVGLVVMVYTGLLLQNTGAVALWSSPLVPVLFLLSSLSCGIATLLLAAYFAPADAATAWLFRMLARVDALIVVLEAAAAALFVAFALADDHPGAVASAQRLAEGDLALWWWVGFALCGLVVPLAVEGVLSARGSFSEACRTGLAVAAVLVLVGGFSMRTALAEAGSHRELALEGAAAEQTSEGEPTGLELRLE